MRISKLLLLMLLLSVSCNQQSEISQLDELRNEAMQLLEDKNYNDAVEKANEAIKGYSTKADSSGMAQAFYIASRASALKGNFDQAKNYGEQSSAILKKHLNYPLEYKVNNTLSWSYFELGRGFNENEKHNERQLFVVAQLDDDNAKASVYNNYGYDATVAGAIPLKDAITYTKFANDHYANSEKTSGRWYTLMNLTWQHRLLNELAKSETYGLMAAAQAKADDDRHAIIEANTNLGETLLAQNKIEDAQPFYEHGLEISKQENDRDKYVFDVYYSRFLWETEKKEDAISLLTKAIEFLENSEVFYEMKARAFLAEYCLSEGLIQEAVEQLEKFKHPRAEYFSQEAKVIASAVEAQIVASEDKKKALNILDNALRDLEESGAELLKLRLLELRAQMQT